MAETGQDDWLGSVDEIRNEINRREKQKETVWNLFQDRPSCLLEGVDDNGMVNINMVCRFFVRDVEGDA